MSVMLDKLLKGQSFEWKKLGDITKVLRGKRLTKSQLADEEKYPVFHGGLEPLGFYNHFNRNANTVMVINVGASAGTIGYSDVDFWSSDGCFCIEKAELLNDKFLYYFLIGYQNYLKSKVRVAGIPTLDALIVEKIEIPIPPLDVQTKIVKILDAFTALTAELTAELNMREKQYHYYRDNLLTFSDDVKRKKLGEVVNIKNGKDWKNLGQGDVPVYGSGGIMTYVDKASYNNVSVLIPRKGSITNIFYTEQPFWNVDTIFYTEIDESQIFPKFFFHFMKNFDLTTLSTDTTRPSLTQAILNKILIPLPSLERQKHIANTLDTFETLTNSITEGLPKEIALRQQQYEYYREQLLDFPK